MMADYVDLLITDDDLTLDIAGEPQLIYDRDCITQDIKHLIRDSGLMVEIVGQRSDITVNERMQRLTLMIEEDTRLVPGTIKITRTSLGLFFVTGTTYKYGPINLEVAA
ncbi:DUF2590 family protein [Methylophaga sp.]|uniref:DUF2590 family protein n=1 Tax=Methylophaga sp. TaxID=2024840 RepID=UPI0025DD3420|nr:DUF2590 family protein [Methylophaga sp.]